MKGKGISTPVVAAIIAAIVLIAGVGYFLLTRPAELVPITLTQLTFSGRDTDPDWSPDGSQLVFSRFPIENVAYSPTIVIDLYVINADGTGLRKIGRGFNPSWSPVENRIAYTLGHHIYTMDSDGQNSVQLTTGEGTHEMPSWSPDGTKIAYVCCERGESSIWVMNADGSGKDQLTTLAKDGSCTGPSFSYDGSKIVYVTRSTGIYEPYKVPTEPNEIWVMDNDGSNKRKIFAPGDSVQLTFQRAWNKDNKILFMRIWLEPYQWRGAPEVWVIKSDGSGVTAVVDSHWCTSGDPVWDLSGTKVAISREESRLHNIFIFS